MQLLLDWIGPEPTEFEFWAAIYLLIIGLVAVFSSIKIMWHRREDHHYIQEHCAEFDPDTIRIARLNYSLAIERIFLAVAFLALGMVNMYWDSEDNIRRHIILMMIMLGATALTTKIITELREDRRRTVEGILKDEERGRHQDGG